jgi:beta-lactamase regulating signal transducer with metallopeptidase domain
MDILSKYLIELFNLVLQTSFQAAILICFIALTTFFFHKKISPRLGHILWFVLLLRLSMFWAPESKVSVYNYLSSEKIKHQYQVLKQTNIEFTSDFNPISDIQPILNTLQFESKSFKPPAPLNVSTILLSIWFGVAFVLLIVVLYDYSIIRRTTKKGKWISDRKLLHLLESCKREIGVTLKIGIIETSAVTAPALFGLIKPRLLLPENTLKELSEERIRFIFLHELIHCKRYDLLLNWWIMVLQIIHWFNPLIWIAFRKIRYNLELTCDELTLTHLRKNQVSEYGHMILHFLEKKKRQGKIPILTGIMEYNNDIKNRIKNIMNVNKSYHKYSRIAVFWVLVVALLFLTNASEIPMKKQNVSRSTNFSDTVRRQGNKVWIDGVEKVVGWGKGEENTFIGSVRVVLSAFGAKYSYSQLMGLSGAAFRLQVSQSDWCPSACDATLGFELTAPALKAVGYGIKSYHNDRNFIFSSKNKMKNAIVKSIDQGKPLIAINLDGEMDWGVITGYDNGGKSLLCRRYNATDDGYVEAISWPYCCMELFDKEIRVSDSRVNILASFKLAVEIANTKIRDGYTIGFNAYAVWIDGLLDDERFKISTTQQLQDLLHHNAWYYSSLCDARKAAAHYLRSVKGEFEGEMYTNIEKAEELYNHITDLLESGRVCAPFAHQLQGNAWTKEMRHYQAEVLGKVYSLEREAIQIFQTILNLNT